MEVEVRGGQCWDPGQAQRVPDTGKKVQSQTLPEVCPTGIASRPY